MRTNFSSVGYHQLMPNPLLIWANKSTNDRDIFNNAFNNTFSIATEQYIRTNTQFRAIKYRIHWWHLTLNPCIRKSIASFTLVEPMVSRAVPRSDGPTDTKDCIALNKSPKVVIHVFNTFFSIQSVVSVIKLKTKTQFVSNHWIQYFLCTALETLAFVCLRWLDRFLASQTTYSTKLIKTLRLRIH